MKRVEQRDQITYLFQCFNLAGAPGFELRNVIPNYVFEMSDEFPMISQNLGTRDFSRASCEKAPHSLLR
jgi:hypothetical protein